MAQQPFVLRNLAMETRESLENQADVSFTIAKHVLLKEGKDSNIIFSPISLQVVLSVIAAGSNKEALDQLLSFLKVKSIHDLNSLYSHLVDIVFADGSPLGGPRLSFANGLWVDNSLSLKPSFKQVVDTVYKAVSDRVDFFNQAEEARELVNSWVEKKTSGLVKDILPEGSVDNSTELIFANALYFKGAWTYEFDASKTKDSDFHLLDGSSLQVPFMTREESRFVSAFDGFKVAKLNYKDGSRIININYDDSDDEGEYQTGDDRFFSMYIFLPDAIHGLPALIEKVCSDSGFIKRHTPYQEVDDGEFLIPKFKFEFQFEAKEALKRLGVDLPFSPNLTEIVESYDLMVKKIFHKSFIEVNEEGTEAAAASAATMDMGCSLVEPEKVVIDFVADHPFLFVIRENLTGIVHFIGHVLNPLAT